MKAFLLLLAVVACVSVTAKPRRWTPDTYPNPRTNPSDCGRSNTSWFCDPDGLVTFESANAVDAILAKVAVGGKPFAQAPCGTSGLEGFPMAVALMHRMYDSTDAAAAAKSFAYSLQDTWGVGDPACDNGVLILLSQLQDQLVVAAGVAVEALLPAETLAGILNDVRVDVKEGRYGAAMELAVTRIGLALADALRPHDDPPSPADPSDHHFHWGLMLEELLVAFGCVSAAVGAIYQQRRRRERAKRQYEDCRSALEGIRQDHLTALQATTAAGGDVVGGSGAGGAPPGPLLQSCCPLCLAHLDTGCTPSGPHFALTLRPRSGTPDDSASEADSASDNEASLRQPLNPTGGAAGGGACAAAPGAISQRPGVMMPCGHAFCEPCIASRLDSHLTACPICGIHADEGATPTSAAAGAGASAAGPADTPALLSGNGSGGSGGGNAQLLARLRERWETARRGGSDPLGPSGSALQFPVLIFRLRQLQREYQQLLPLDMTRVWEQDLRDGRDLDAHQMRTFKRRDPSTSHGGLLGTWRIVRRHASRLRGLRLWRTRR